MREALCTCEFVEDATEYWSRGNYYNIISIDEDGNYIMENNYGQGIIYAEDFEDYFDEYDKTKIRYYICALGYDANYCVTDYEKDFGDFDTYEEAYETFVKLQCKDAYTFFKGVDSKVEYIKLQLEMCEETEEEINCIDVRNEIDIERVI